MKINVTSVFVEDQHTAFEFYTEVLGFIKKTDIPAGDFKWLTVVSREDPEGVELLLEPNVHEAARSYQEALYNEGIPAISFTVTDLLATYQELADKGVVFTVSPTESGPVTFAIFDDTCGNLIQLSQERGEEQNTPLKEGDMHSLHTEKAKMIAGEMYHPLDEKLTKERMTAQRLTRIYNQTGTEDDQKRYQLLTDLLGSTGKQIVVEPVFRCDYGYNIHVGENFYAKFNCVILDACPVYIGDNCMMGPAVQIYTSAHPLDASERNSGKEYGQSIRIGDNVWIGGGAIINPGVSIGDNVVIASGSVVTKSVGSNVVVGGNAAKVIREL